MHNEKITIERIKRLIQRIGEGIYLKQEPLNCCYVYNQEAPIPYSDLGSLQFAPIKVGEVWGHAWGSAWFKLSGEFQPDTADLEAGLWLDFDGEACVWQNGIPRQGLTNKVDWYHNAAKQFVPLDNSAAGRFEVLVEAAANELFGSGKNDYILREACFCLFDRELWQRYLDIGLLLNLAEALPKGCVRRKRIIFGLNEMCNLWNSDRTEAKNILSELLSHKANSSALTAISVGHAHLDLAWLWPIRETIRKGGRTFANALRYMESYPDYVFGASQAQLYAWMKEHYPGLYDEVKQVVKAGRWEIQGASWVEFDTNLTGGESIIRQFMYGRDFFTREFGITPNTLWLPDCFGFNANIPQLMLGCGVDHFVTQKLSWNETNVFPEHLFYWEGIDGSRVLAHQMPTNDYNFSNNPSSMLETESRYEQAELSDHFLNMFGIGDGGGGPTAHHIEYGLRMRDLEGLPKFRFAKSTAFFEEVNKIPPEKLPVVYGELYLELHRGTYTTQALMKKNNRESERSLGMAEFILALFDKPYPEELRAVWRDVLLLQFHDILPGSSIGKVYEDAKRISENCHLRIKEMVDSIISQSIETHASDDTDHKWYIIVNNSCRETTKWHSFTETPVISVPYDSSGHELIFTTHRGMEVLLKVPAFSYVTMYFATDPEVIFPQPKESSLILENDLVRAEFSPHGTLISMFDKEIGRQVLSRESNILNLWEDLPNNWGAWDINHFYHETTPKCSEEAVWNRDESFSTPEKQCLVFDFRIGKSTLKQTVELWHDKLLRFNHRVDWQETHKMLRVHFYPEVHAQTATYEIQFGVIKRSNKPRNQSEHAQFEVPAHRFADLSQADHGLALINDCKYGYRVRDNEMELDLLRSPADVDPQADMHIHEYGYAIYSHADDYEHSDVMDVAHDFNGKLCVLPISGEPEIKARTLLVFSDPHIRLETVKPAEDGDGLILRLYEFLGKDHHTTFTIPSGYHFLSFTDMIERRYRDDEEKTGIIQLEFKPFEIKTLRLRK
ncbi:MAG TPA: glycoside hydrolase family 38 C-terminal domain-containing protein [Candidatus Cloacimonadota bacterium]|nr:glycoside hydrolase family 38 C-terminal domain-containing protein [Candidatus Cloacimonadota bacterium]